MKQFCTLLFIIITSTSLAQTKLIAFKSHSGNMDNFSIALENALFNEEESNFGNPPVRTIYYLDSIIYISRSTAVLVTRKYQYPWGGSKDSAEFLQVRKDTVHTNPIFSKNHLLDSIRHLDKTSSFTEHETKNTVLISYDNKKNPVKKKDTLNNDNKPKEKNVSPIVTTVNGDPGNTSLFDAAMAKALAGIFLLALLGGWLSSKFYNLRLQKA